MLQILNEIMFSKLFILVVIKVMFRVGQLADCGLWYRGCHRRRPPATLRCYFEINRVTEVDSHRNGSRIIVVRILEAEKRISNRISQKRLGVLKNSRFFKFNNLKQAHSNTIYKSFEKSFIDRFEMFGKFFLSKLF